VSDEMILAKGEEHLGIVIAYRSRCRCGAQ
jgi:hypothetical protein